MKQLSLLLFLSTLFPTTLHIMNDPKENSLTPCKKESSIMVLPLKNIDQAEKKLASLVLTNPSTLTIDEWEQSEETYNDEVAKWAKQLSTSSNWPKSNTNADVMDCD